LLEKVEMSFTKKNANSKTPKFFLGEVWAKLIFWDELPKKSYSKNN